MILDIEFAFKSLLYDPLVGTNIRDAIEIVLKYNLGGFVFNGVIVHRWDEDIEDT